MQQTHDEQQAPGTGPGVGKARLPGEIIPTALAGPAQKGREPLPIILPHIAIGRAVTPNIPALTAARAAAVASPAAACHPTQVLTPVTNEGKGETTGAHEHQPEVEEGAEIPGEPIAPPPPAVPGQESGYPLITTPIPTPGDLSHTTPVPSAPVQRQAQQWSPRHQRLFLAGLGSGLLVYLLALVLVAVFVAPVVTLAAAVTLKDPFDDPHHHNPHDRHP